MKTLILPFAIMFIIAGCNKESATTNIHKDEIPSLTTEEASSVTSTSAKLGGTVADTGSCTISAYGVVISTAHNPTTSQATYTANTISNTGSFTIMVGSLMPGTTYYARAYATNCNGTGYGNEIKFTTLVAGGVSDRIDTGYFRLTTGGVTYFSYDLLSPLCQTVFPEGDTRFAVVTWDSVNQVFGVAANSSFLLNPSQSFGFSFGYTNPDVHGAGTYNFAKSNSAHNKDITISLRTATGASDPLLANFNSYLNGFNLTRQKTADDCVQKEITSAINTLIITRWGNPGEYIEGTINGTLYENFKADANCINSTPRSFIVEFKLQRWH